MDRLYLPFVAVVRLIITHFRPHLDELGAWWLARRFGENIFPGIESAKLVLWNAGNRNPDGRSSRDWKEKDGALLLGVGGAITDENPDGAEFDEHGLNSEESTMTLMAKALGLTTEPALRSMLTYAQANDRKGKSSPWDLASILKALNSHTLNTLQVAEMVFDILNANYNRGLRPDPAFTPHAHANLFDEQLATWLWDGFAGKAIESVDRPVTATEVIELLRIEGREDLGEIGKLARRDHAHGAAGPFDIVTLFSELVENGADANFQRAFVFNVMNAKFGQQRRFMQATDEVRANVTITWVGDKNAIDTKRKSRIVENPETLKAIADLQAMNPDSTTNVSDTIESLRASMVKPAEVLPNATILAVAGIRPVQIVSVVSDNEEVLKAMRVLFPSAQFYIRRQTSGHTVINGPKHLMDSVCAETRIAENMRRNGSAAPRIPLDHLRKAGNISEDPVWSYHREGGQMLNGSLTSPGAPRTVQSLESLWKGISRAIQYTARYESRVRISGAPPPSKSSSPKPPTDAPVSVPKGGGQHGRRPEDTAKKSESYITEGFDNRPFAELPPADIIPPQLPVPAVTETPEAPAVVTNDRPKRASTRSPRKTRSKVFATMPNPAKPDR